MGRIGLFVNHAIVLLFLLVKLNKCSEFPERECCDPIYPYPDLELTPALPTATIVSSPASVGGNAELPGRSGKVIVRNICPFQVVEFINNSSNSSPMFCNLWIILFLLIFLSFSVNFIIFMCLCLEERQKENLRNWNFIGIDLYRSNGKVQTGSALSYSSIQISMISEG